MGDVVKIYYLLAGQTVSGDYRVGTGQAESDDVDMFSAA